MKTAIIKTDIWKDKKIRQMHIDTKLLYLCLITNPDRNTTRFLKIDDDYISFISGIDHRQLALCKKQLEELCLIYFIDDWCIYSNESYVTPAKGKLTATIFEKDMLEVPKNIVAYSEEKHLSSSCAVQVYINKDINNNKNTYNNTYSQNKFSRKYKTPDELGLTLDRRTA